MKRYDEYKQTGTPWIGEIPSHWEDSRLKYIGEYINGYAFKPEDWSSEGLPIIRIQDLTESNSNPNYFKGTINEKYLIKDGDILVSWAATLAAFKWNKGDAWLNQHIFKAIPNLNINYDFFFWILRIAMKNMKNGEEHGIMMEHVTSDLFGNFPIPVPPLGEQEAIAAYLDKKCGSIDAVISTQERRIALLEELKQSVITEAVTHGINPDAKLRPSGIDWIGNIPEYWICTKAKYYIDIKSGETISNESINAEDSYPVFGGGEIIGYCKEANIRKGTIIIGRVGARCGCVRIADKDSWATDNALIVTTNQNPSFFYRLFEAANLNILNESNAQPLITATKVKDLRITLPPLSEQEEIVEYIESKIKPIDASIAKAKREIELLKELKQSVITEAVTGKIKVC